MKIQTGRLIVVSLILVTMTQVTNAQTFAITQMEMEGVKLSIYYDLLDKNVNKQYTIKLFSSRDNFSQPLKNVSGDIGVPVLPGSNKKIVLNITEEFGADFEDKISFRIRGILYDPFLKLNQNFTKLKRGKLYLLTWAGGIDKEPLTIELLSNNRKIMNLAAVNNEQTHSLKLPPTLQVGKPYRLKIYSSNDEDRVVYTNEFVVQRKIPLLFKALPVVAIGSIIIFTSTSGKSNHLPDPIKP